MFRRKEDGSEELIESAEGDTSTKGFVPSPTPSAKPATAPAAQPMQASVPQSAPAAGPAPAFRPAPPQAAMGRPAQSPVDRPAPRPNTAKRVLTVGPDIQMKGEIMTCDRVVIEGIVDAAMKDVHTVELAETGTLKGVAEVEDAEISGSFEGDLNVRGKLTVYASGRVRGNVTYGEIEIQRGGQISGNIRNVAEAKAGAGKKAA